jgi:hypothetical protein
MVRLPEPFDHWLTPLSGLLGVLASGAQLPIFDAVAATIWTQSGTLFTGLSITAFTLCAEVSFLPTCSTIEMLALAVGAVFLVKLGADVLSNFTDRLDDD